jgi:membrane-associated phospholipid phosphatase
MEAVLQAGLDIIRTIQSFSHPSLTTLMRIITAFGSTQAYVILLPLVYWCIDEKKGLRLGIAVLVSAWINISLKFLLNQPRPFFEAYDPALGMIAEELGGFPSGHAQNSLVKWFIIASWSKRKWPYAAAALICLLISFSRIYLGVHFPTDILGGWMLGGLVLCAYFFLVKQLEPQPDGESRGRGFLKECIERGGFRAELMAAAAAAFIMILYRPSEEAIMPGGMLFGMALGYSLNKRYIGFKSSGVLGKTGIAKYTVLACRFLLGIAVTALIFAAFEKITPENRFSGRESTSLFGETSDYYLILYFLRFVCMGLWVCAGAPRLYCFLRLAEHNEEAQ